MICASTNASLTPRVNPILFQFRTFCGPDEWGIGPADVPDYADSWVDLIDNEDRADPRNWGPLAGTDDGYFEHARNVLSRLAKASV